MPWRPSGSEQGILILHSRGRPDPSPLFAALVALLDHLARADFVSIVVWRSPSWMPARDAVQSFAYVEVQLSFETMARDTSESRCHFG